MIKLNEKEIQDKIKWIPHPNQQKILNGIKRYTTICAGTRFGKSALCAYIALRRVLEFYSLFESVRSGQIKPTKEIEMVLTKGCHIWVVAPTYELSKKIYVYLSMFVGNMFAERIKGGSVRLSDRMGAIKIEFKPVKGMPVSAWIEFKSAENPTSLLGEELDLVIVDECSRTKRSVWESYLYSRLTSRKGTAVFISTPFGQNWFYDEWMKGRDKTKPEYAAFHFTSKDNPYFPIKEWENAKKRLPQQVFNQEHEASFLPDAASVFRGVEDVIKDNALMDLTPGHYYVMGVDIGKHEDFTVITVIDKYNNNVVYWDRFRKIEYPFQKKRIIATAKRYGARIFIDSTSVGEPIFDDLNREGLFIDDYRFTNKSKKELIEKLSIFIEQKRIYIPPEQVLVDELHSFGYKLSDSGNVIYGAPEGLHDDAVISLALAVWGLQGQPRPETAHQRRLKEIQESTRKPFSQQYI